MSLRERVALKSFSKTMRETAAARMIWCCPKQMHLSGGETLKY